MAACYIRLDMPFLTVITRAYKRPHMLAANQRSLADQTDPDYEQVILRDEIGIGVAAANVLIRHTIGLVRGEYVLILDDDDLIVDMGLIANLKHLTADRPGVVMVRWDHGERGILPYANYIGAIPPRGAVGGGSPIVRADLFRALAHTWGASYDGDYDYVTAVLTSGQPVVWHDKVVCAVQRISLGRPEDA